MTEVYYDVETQLSASEVGGWQNAHLMRISVAVTWSREDGFLRWHEDDIPTMLDYMKGFDRVVSFNGDGFDIRVLSFYGDVAPLRKKSFDVLVDLKKRLGHRLGLDALASATFGVGKSADGMTALRWWKEGNIEAIAEYCRRDVHVLVDLVAYGRTHGVVRYEDQDGTIRTVAVQW